MDDDYKIKPLQIMLPKTRTHPKGCDGKIKLNGCMFQLKMMNYKKIRSYLK